MAGMLACAIVICCETIQAHPSMAQLGADIISPMAAPVLGGILIADEVVDLLLPIVFFGIRRRRWQRYHRSISSNCL